MIPNTERITTHPAAAHVGGLRQAVVEADPHAGGVGDDRDALLTRVEQRGFANVDTLGLLLRRRGGAGPRDAAGEAR
jgi:hypothetical protein